MTVVQIENMEDWLGEVSPEDMRRVVDALYRVHGLHAAVTDVDKLLDAIMDESKHVAGAEACSLLLYDTAEKDLYFQVALSDAGDQDALKQGLRLKLGEGVGGLAAQSRATINVEDAASDPRVVRMGGDLAGFETRSLLAVPLVDRETLVGVLEVVNKVGGGPFTEFDQHITEMFSSQAASVITRARLIEENLQGERMAAVGQTVAGLSHYAKNIILGMSGSVELLETGFKEQNERLVTKGWPILKRSVGRMTNIVEDMLAYSTPREPLREPCDIRKLVDEVVETFYGISMEEGIEVITELTDIEETGLVKLDARGMHRCLLNLLTNAADAVESGTGTIRVRARASSDDTLEFEVADNGPGIPENKRQRVFEVFYSTKGSKGTGLGLAVTHKLVIEHGGTISVTSSDLGGACFQIQIPLVRN